MEEPTFEEPFAFEDPLHPEETKEDFQLISAKGNLNVNKKRKQSVNVNRASKVRDPIAIQNRRAAWSLFLYSLLLVSVITFTLYDSASIVYDCYKYMKSVFMEATFDIEDSPNITRVTSNKTIFRNSFNFFLRDSASENHNCVNYFLNRFPGLLFGEILNDNSVFGVCQKFLPPSPSNQHFLINKMIGLPRIRQLRVRPRTCKIHDLMEGLFDTCYGLYDEENEDRMNIKPKLGNVSLWSSSAWNYTKASTYGESISGTFGTYPPSGYMTLLGSNENRTKMILKNLKENGWIDQETRAVIVEFSHYNAHMNFFIFTKLLVEFPTTGILKTTGSFYACQLFMFLKEQDFIFAALRIMFAVFIAAHCVELAVSFYRYRLQLFGLFRIHLNIAFLLASIVYLVMHVIHFLIIEPMAFDLMLTKGVYVNFDLIKTFHYYFTASSVIMALLLWVEFFRRLVEKSNAIVGAFPMIFKVMKEQKDAILSSLVLFLVLNLSFSFVAHLRLGSHVLEFNSFKSSFVAMMMTLGGVTHYEQIQDLNMFLELLFQSCFHFMITFIYQQWFLAIMTAGYRLIVKRQKFAANQAKLYGFARTDDKMPKSIRNILNVKDAYRRANFRESDINHFFSQIHGRSLDNISEYSAKQIIRVLKEKRNDHFGEKYMIASERELLQTFSVLDHMIKTLDSKRSQLKTLHSKKKRK